MNWLLIGLIVFVAFSCLMTLALCRAARLGDEIADRLAERRCQLHSDGGESEC